MKNSLRGKAILFIAPKFFAYEEQIKNELLRRGATVDWLRDRPFDSPLLVGLVKICAKLLFPITNKIYRKNLAAFAEDKYDIILVINGQTLSPRFLKHLISLYPGADKILYLWDSIKNRPSVMQNVFAFDRIYTFDPIDAQRFGWNFRPLFYVDHSKENPLEEIAYDLSFVGTVHSDRYKIAKRLKESLPKEVNFYLYFYVQSVWVYLVYKLFKPCMWAAKKTEFNFKPLSKKDLYKTFQTSIIILDIEHPSQVGLTMRTFETLGAHKKLVTTNAGIKNYEFYNESNICVIDRENPFVPPEFFKLPFVQLNQNLRKQYSIEGWLDDLLAVSK